MAMKFEGPVPTPSQQAVPLTVLITGSSRGLGLELVKQYAEAHPDNSIFATARSTSVVALDKLAATHPNVHLVPLDVSDGSSITASVKSVSALTDHIDLLFNNAGIYGNKQSANALTVTGAQLSELLNINVTGVLLVTQAYLPLLLKAKSAKVINMTTGSNALAAYFGAVNVNLGYGVSKAALNYLTTTFRYSVPSITFLSCHPGWVGTDMGNGAGFGDSPNSTADCVQAVRYYAQQKGIEHSGEFFDVITGDNMPF